MLPVFSVDEINMIIENMDIDKFFENGEGKFFEDEEIEETPKQKNNNLSKLWKGDRYIRVYLAGLSSVYAQIQYQICFGSINRFMY